MSTRRCVGGCHQQAQTIGDLQVALKFRLVAGQGASGEQAVGQGFGFASFHDGSHSKRTSIRNLVVGSNVPSLQALRRLLRENRRLAQMTQRELATRLGRWQSFVSDVESGRYG
jgi:hypothetical protein